MTIEVLVEPLPNSRYRATSGAPLAAAAEGGTRDEALAQLKEQLENRLKNGTELVPLQLAGEPNPWLDYAGMFNPNDPLVKEWKRQMARNRRKREADPNFP